MTQEEKALAYDEAIQKAKDYYDGKTKMYSDINKVLELIFPELQESKDGRIRKGIIKFLIDVNNGAYTKSESEIASWIAWLGKQGEQKVPVNDFKAKDWYVSKVDGKIHNIYHSVDKVEPKFKVGDWIINKHRLKVYQVVYIHEIEESYILNDENHTYISGSWIDDYRLWTIEDAKDGDVLYSLDSNQPFIYKDRKPYEQATAYCGINKYGKFFVWRDQYCIITLYKYIPATQEQRDLLFSKMKEAGYEWDANEKELVKLSNSPKWSEEDEEMCQETIDWFEKKCFPYALEHENPARECISWLKSLKQRLEEQQ